VLDRAQVFKQAEKDSTFMESEQQCGVQPRRVLPEDEEQPFVGSEFNDKLFLSGQERL